MKEALELVRQGDGWNVTIFGMVAVFVSLVSLVFLINGFAAIIQSMEKKRARRTELREEAPPPTVASEPSSEVAIAAAIALAGGDTQGETTAAISYAIYDYLQSEAWPQAVPTRIEVGGDGRRPDPWCMAGRMRLMNSRIRMMK